MTIADRSADAIFADARFLYDDALEMLELGRYAMLPKKHGAPPSEPPMP